MSGLPLSTNDPPLGAGGGVSNPPKPETKFTEEDMTYPTNKDKMAKRQNKEK